MSAYLAGLAILRCAEHEQAAEIDSVMRLTLAAMGSFAGSDTAPECYAALSSVAGRAGLNRRSAERAVARLEAAGLIERAGKAGKTVRWRLVLLCGRESHKPEALVRQRVAQEPSTAESRTRSTAESRTILPSPTTPREEDDGRSGADGAPPSAGAPGSALAPSTTPASREPAEGTAGAGTAPPGAAGGLAGEVAGKLGVSIEAAQRRIDAWEANANGQIRNFTSYIRTCLQRELAAGQRAPRKARRPAGGYDVEVSIRPEAGP